MKRVSGIILSFVLISSSVFGDYTYEPQEENLQAREWFRNSKFGLFIHFGPYSVLEKGEWILERSKRSLEEYTNEATSKFNPSKFDPAAWVALAKDAGMKYITVTSRHHDGFAMWATKQNEWNIVDASPYRIDFLKQLSEECQRQDMKLFIYYSQLDWNHLDYFPLGITGHHSGRPKGGDFNKYLDYMDAQLTELLTGYGKVAGVWFDGMWDKPGADWRIEQTYSLIHRLQPATLVGSNHHLTPFAGEDIQMFEKDLPGQFTQEFNQVSTEISSLPLETCETINNSWGYKSSDKNFKSSKDLIHYLLKAAGNNTNFLLNVGPRPDGTIQPEFIERLQIIGHWLRKNGDSIYETRGGPIKPMSWGVTTQKGNNIYLHILQWENELLSIPNVGTIVRATNWATGSQVAVTQDSRKIVLQIPKTDVDEIDTIIELELAPADT
ncbi:MAG: alpha-L-fucosidase [Parachlamydiaceae bacterium]|nr:alpha-L-fucosidase [Parachlamydiaceae bacterium]